MKKCGSDRCRAVARAMRRGAPCPMRVSAAERRPEDSGIVFCFTTRSWLAQRARLTRLRMRPAYWRCGVRVVLVDPVCCACRAWRSVRHAQLQVMGRRWAQHIDSGRSRIVRRVAEEFAVAGHSTANLANCAERLCGMCWTTRSAAGGLAGGGAVARIRLRSHRRSACKKRGAGATGNVRRSLGADCARIARCVDAPTMWRCGPRPYACAHDACACRRGPRRPARDRTL